MGTRITKLTQPSGPASECLRGRCPGCKRMMASEHSWANYRDVMRELGATTQFSRRGHCATCATRLRRHGQLEIPRRRAHKREAVMDEWIFCRDDLGMTLREAAVHLGIRYPTLEQMYYRARAAGDMRANRTRYAPTGLEEDEVA